VLENPAEQFSVASLSLLTVMAAIGVPAGYAVSTL
jgi:hypothetical protein